MLFFDSYETLIHKSFVVLGFWELISLVGLLLKPDSVYQIDKEYWIFYLSLWKVQIIALKLVWKFLYLWKFSINF